jgi:voltage-gated potassium channel
MNENDRIPPERLSPWRRQLGHIIFDHDTPGSKAFDVALLIAIVLGVLVVMLESVKSVDDSHGPLLKVGEWVFTIIFTFEYVLRLIASPKPLRYAFSFYGIVDFLSFIPTYIEPFFTGAHFLLVIRILRLMRLFRILKMMQYVGQGNQLMRALRASRPKIIVFMFFVIILVIILGAIMYIVENPVNDDFSSIPTSVYWAVVTLTTVGYGDITPITVLGKMISVFVMLMGYAIIAVPTGIVIGEMETGRALTRDLTVPCPRCHATGHETDARFCRHCGGAIHGPGGE